MKLSLLLLTVCSVVGSAVIAQAGTINLDSSATNTTNNSVSLGIADAGATENILPNSSWYGPLAGSSWISYADTGSTSDPNFYTVPNGTAVTFSQSFNVSGTVTNAVLNVLADDTTSVVLNGITIYSAVLGGSYPLCSSQAIGCLESTEGNFSLASFGSDLKQGTNTLSFTTYQENGYSYGLDYVGSVATATPEPASVTFVGLGLAGAAFWVRRKAGALKSQANA
ncbi:PEP-CTERM sorting domain-containing protein [Nevskia soli]|uniref:PEP-CTERM sorting domain-containing protein n=1 Tax=Nevskia soli TaxID=418856 RepID=UPI0015D7AEEF|nr:PEP-CTERM sorting domain-containing protein [Nevskia soli]